jgi:hypothetical protein
LLGRDPDDPNGERGNRRVLAHVKSNFGRQATSLAFQIVQKPLDETFPHAMAAEIVETGTSSVEGADLLQSRSESEPPAVIAEAVAFVQAALAQGPRTAKDLESAASQAGIPWETVKRAKRPAGVKTRKQRGVQDGPWIWELTEDRQTAEQPAA